MNGATWFEVLQARCLIVLNGIGNGRKEET